MLTSLFYVTGEFHRFLHRGRANFEGFFILSLVYFSIFWECF